jgi:hypothetical protein
MGWGVGGGETRGPSWRENERGRGVDGKRGGGVEHSLVFEGGGANSVQTTGEKSWHGVNSVSMSITLKHAP